MSDVAVAPSVLPPPGLPPGGPTFAGFKWFVENMMGVPTGSVPPDSWLAIAYSQALDLAYIGLAGMPSPSFVNTSYVGAQPPSIYAFAVYNLGCAMLLMFAQDDPTAVPPSTFWADLRQKLGVNSFTPGLITSAADQGTSDSFFIPDAIKHMTLLDLQLAKSPWGLQYLMFAGEWGSIWGITF